MKTGMLLLFFGASALFVTFPAGAANLAPENLISHVARSERLTLEFTEKSIVFHNDGSVTSSGTRSDPRPGAPQMPVQYLDFALPFGTDIATVRVRASDIRTETINKERFALRPVPTLVKPADSGGPAVLRKFEKNPDVYGRDEFYPAEIVSVAMAGHLAACPYVTLKYYPFQYNPETRTLRKITRARVEVLYEQAPDSLSKSPARQSPHHVKEARQRFINHDEVLSLAGLKYEELVWRARKPGYAIITRSAYKNGCLQEFQDFMQHKAEKYACYLITEADFGGYPGAAHEKIRAWLVDNYQAYNLQYVLLVGDPHPDTGDVPMPKIFLCPMINRDNPSHIYYMDLTGDWDRDNDGVIGENMGFYTDMPPTVYVHNSPPFCIKYMTSIKVPPGGAPKLRLEYYRGEVSVRVRYKFLFSVQSDKYDTYDFQVDTTSPACPLEILYIYNGDDASIRLLQDFDDNGSYDQLSVKNYAYWTTDGAVYTEYWKYRDNICTEKILHEIDMHKSVFWIVPWWNGDMGPGGPDRMTEVGVGHIPIYGHAYPRLKRILKKIETYERQETFPNCQRNQHLVAVRKFDDPPFAYKLGEAIRNILPVGHSITRIYDGDFGLSPPPERTPNSYAAMLDEWTKTPRAMVTWWAHGAPNLADQMITSGTCGVLNDAKPSVVFQESCNNGRPERSDNLAAALLENGAIAALASSRADAGPGDHPYNLFAPGAEPSAQMMGFYLSALMTFGSCRLPVSDSHNFTRTNILYWQNPFFYNPNDHYTESYGMRAVTGFNIYGDPAVSLWSDYAPHLDIQLVLTASHLKPGDHFQLDLAIASRHAAALDNVPLFLILEIPGIRPTFLYWPDWTAQPNSKKITINPGDFRRKILSFTWPNTISGRQSGLKFHAALTNNQKTDLLCNFDTVEWSYGR